MEAPAFIDRMKDETEAACADSSPGTTVRQQQIDRRKGESGMTVTVTPPDAQAAVPRNRDALCAERSDDHSLSLPVDGVLETTDRTMQQTTSFDPSRLADYNYAEDRLIVVAVGTEATPGCPQVFPTRTSKACSWCTACRSEAWAARPLRNRTHGYRRDHAGNTA